MLPPDLLLSREQIAALDAEHEKSKKERGARARADRERIDSSGGGDSGTLWNFGEWGDGSGGD